MAPPRAGRNQQPRLWWQCHCKAWTWADRSACFSCKSRPPLWVRELQVAKPVAKPMACTAQGAWGSQPVAPTPRATTPPAPRASAPPERTPESYDSPPPAAPARPIHSWHSWQPIYPKAVAPYLPTAMPKRYTPPALPPPTKAAMLPPPPKALPEALPPPPPNSWPKGVIYRPPVRSAHSLALDVRESVWPRGRIYRHPQVKEMPHELMHDVRDSVD